MEPLEPTSPGDLISWDMTPPISERGRNIPTVPNALIVTHDISTKKAAGWQARFKAGIMKRVTRAREDAHKVFTVDSTIGEILAAKPRKPAQRCAPCFYLFGSFGASD